MKHLLKIIKILFVTIIAFILIFLTFYLFEVNIRRFIFIPPTYEFFSDKKIKLSNTLVLDKEGIFRHSTEFIERINQLDEFYKNKDRDSFLFFFNEQNTDPISIYYFWNHIAKYSNKEVLQIEHKLIQKPIKRELDEFFKERGYYNFMNRLLTEYDSLIEDKIHRDVRQYINRPVNTNGFRSIPFNFQETNRKKLLLLGDSFTYGFSSMPFQKSFADLLLTEGFLTYNCGIPGTNVINYLANAEKFIPLLKPDYVFTFYFEANDAINFPWDTIRTDYLPGHIYENGIMPSIINNKYYPEPDLWKSAFKECTEKYFKNSFLNNVLIYHLIVNRLYKNKINRCFPAFNNPDTENTNYYLRCIDEIALKNEAKHIIIIIPTQKSDIKRFKVKYQNSIFKNTTTFYPEIFNQNDYRTENSDPHFNNSGHLKLKDYIIELIANQGL